MRKAFLFLFFIPLIAVSQCDTVYVETPVIYGCMWPNSCNYNDEATVDDGSCLDCTTPYEVGELLCDYYHGVDGIWAAWVAWKCGVLEPPIVSCDTMYVQLPADTVEIVNYITLDPDTVYSVTSVDCFTGFPCDGCNYEIYVPNSFTPNGDGLNDTFCPFAETLCWDELKFNVYNRWGQLVYEGDVLNGVCWDGIGFSQGIYVWSIMGVGSSQSIASGHVLLLN